MRVKLRQSVRRALGLALQFAGALLAGSGAAVALFLGKLFAAVVLAAITVGILLRFANRRQRTEQ